LPGEKALINRNRSLKDGVSLEKNSIKILENIAEKFQIDL